MNLPGLNAAASIYRSARVYAATAAYPSAAAGRVVPAWCNTYSKGGDCYTRCCDCYMGDCNCWTTLPRPI